MKVGLAIPFAVGWEYDNEPMTGAVWNLATGEVEAAPRPLAAVNAVGHVVSGGVWGTGVPKLIRGDGTQVRMVGVGDRRGHVEVLFEPDAELTAAGTADNNEQFAAVVWRGC